jgi:hypothetical protein
MKTLIKKLPCENGELYAMTDDRRILLARCEAEVRLYEVSRQVPILGRGKVITGREMAMLITFEHTPEAPPLNSVSGFAFQGETRRSDGDFERLRFRDCLLTGELDLTRPGSCEFELRCSQDTLERLLAL